MTPATATEPAAEPAEPAEPSEPSEPTPDDDQGEPVEPTPDDDQGEPSEPAEPSPSPQTPEQMEKQQKQLERETERHVKRVAEIVGDDFPWLVACELCHPLMPGFRLPREPEDDVKQAVRFAIGDRQPENWQPDQFSRQCEYCAGLGEVVTGSKVRGQETLGCLGCDSRGWLPIGDERRGTRVAPAATTVPDNGGAEHLSVPDTDPPEVAALKRQGYVIIKPTPVA